MTEINTATNREELAREVLNKHFKTLGTIDYDEAIRAMLDLAAQLVDAPTIPAGELPTVMPGHWDTAEGREKALDYVSKPRAEIAKADISDFAVANAVFMADRNDFELIVWQTVAKDRIRWLSTQLALALSVTPRSSEGEDVRELVAHAIIAWDNDMTPEAAAHPNNAAFFAHWLDTSDTRDGKTAEDYWKSADTILAALRAAPAVLPQADREGGEWVLVKRADLQFCIDAIAHLKEQRARFRLEQMLTAAQEQRHG